MKKIYLIPAFALIAGVSFGQRNFNHIPEHKAIKEAQGNVVSLSNAEQSSSRAIIWQNNFNNPSDWTMSNSSSPAADWMITATMPANLASQNFARINSTSGGNFAIIDSDGPGASATQNARIVTANSIDLTNYPGVILKFQDYHIRFLEKHFVLVSTDGLNWTEIPVNLGYAANTSSANPTNVSVNVTAQLAGQPTAYIGFRYEGAYDWFWMIDDVKLEEAPENDLTMDYRFYGEYSKVPLSQVMPIEFAGSATNNGSLSQTGVKMNVKVTGGNASYDETSTANVSLSPGATDTIYLAQSFTPTETGNYSFAYEITQDQVDANSADNKKTAVYAVTDSVFSRDNNNYISGGAWNGPNTAYEIGNLFEVTNGGYVTSGTFVLASTTVAGASVRLKLYDANGASFELINNTDFFDIVAANINTAATTNPKSVTVAFESPIMLEPGEYLLVLEHSDPSKDVVIATGTDIVQPAQTSFLLDNGTWYYISSTPMIRLNMSHQVGVNEVASNNAKLFNAQPNPSRNHTSIRYELTSNTKVSLQITDLSGKTVFNSYEGQKSPGAYSINVNTANLDNGIYFYTLITNEGRKTQRLVVAK
jgi:hypothetical protein